MKNILLTLTREELCYLYDSVEHYVDTFDITPLSEKSEIEAQEKLYALMEKLEELLDQEGDDENENR